MYTDVYMDVDGKLKEKKFETLEEARAFLVEHSKKDIPMKKFEDKSKKMKTRIEEVQDLISNVTLAFEHSIEKLDPGRKIFSDIMTLKENLVKYEIEKHELLAKNA